MTTRLRGTTAAGILARYVSVRVLMAILAMFTVCVVLIFFVDFIEMLRRSGKSGNAPALLLAYVTLLRLPSFTELTLPFAVLIGSMGGYLLLSRSSELVVIRAAGISVWQFVLPGVLVAFIIGILAVTLYNPVAATAMAESERLFADAFNRERKLVETKGAGAWLRQDGDDGQSIIHAKASANSGFSLSGVTVLEYDADKRFMSRVEADTAELRDGRWELANVWVSGVGQPPQFFNRYLLSTYLSPAQVRDSLGSVRSMSFWELPTIIAIAERAGLSATQFKLQYQLLLSRPFLLAVMVLVAATCSLKGFRFGSIQKMAVAGLAAGFGFFILAEISRNLGLAGVTSPWAAAWVPVLIGSFLALTVLLYQEDG